MRYVCFLVETQEPGLARQTEQITPLIPVFDKSNRTDGSPAPISPSIPTQPSLPSAPSACYPMHAMNIAGGDRFGCWVIVKGDATGKSSPSVFARDLTAIEMARGIWISTVSSTIVEELMKDFGPFSSRPQFGPGAPRRPAPSAQQRRARDRQYLSRGLGPRCEAR